MKSLIFFLTLLLLSPLSFGRIEKNPYVSHWQLVMEGSKGGNTIRSIERKIVTPYSSYTVGQVTMMELTFKGGESLDSTREFLKKQFRLTGLQEKKVKNSWRFEGYREDIRRQVVIFISYPKGKIKVSSGFYRPSYGITIPLEMELIHRKYHSIEDKVSWFKIPDLSALIISEAHAQTDCTRCAGNPMCLMLCRSANGGGSIPTGGGGPTVPAGPPGGGISDLFGGGGGIGGLNLDQIQAQLNQTNSQLTALNGNMGTMNQNWGETNTQLGTANQNWANTNTQLDALNTNLVETNTQLGTANENWSQTNQELANANQNLQNLNNTIDTNAQKAMEESQAWRAMTEKESQEWRAMMQQQGDRALTVAERMSDPNHLFKVATFSAAGAVLGSTVANLAISGVQSAVGFLFKWATGELRDMKEEELLREFEQAMKVYNQSSDIAKALETSIDAVLSNIALHQRFQLQNSEVLANIQRHIIETEFAIEDATRDRCVEDLIGLNQKLVEFQSLAKILDMADPQRTMCLDLKEMFRKLAEIEGVLQGARPNLLKAEEAVTNRIARTQNDNAEILEGLRRGDLSEDVLKRQNRQQRELYERNVRDSREISRDITKDCEDSFKAAVQTRIPKESLESYCRAVIFGDGDNTTREKLSLIFPIVPAAELVALNGEFTKKMIPDGVRQYQTYQEQREELFATFRATMENHAEVTTNMRDRLYLDPRVALNEMTAMNEFFQKLMREQVFLYTDGMKTRRAQFEEACQSVNP